MSSSSMPCKAFRRFERSRGGCRFSFSKSYRRCRLGCVMHCSCLNDVSGIAVASCPCLIRRYKSSATTFHLPMILYILLAGISLFYISNRLRRPSNQPNPDALPSVLVPAYTTHSRSLPTPSRHSFSYPLLYVAIDIDSLETGFT